ncbi:FliH/SctL family protein [Microbacterium sp. USHLN186]|uniref:FliH/SctL family protein n=1 Tax=Microbacterium sp. USHLN186 TaxID=3081286 RepID=UPI00301AE74B
MSTDAFAPAVFPRLRGADADAERLRARRRGYADGHADGFRVAAAEAAQVAAQQQLQREEADAAAQRALASALSALQAATEALDARTQNLAALAEQQISARAIELAEAILAEALTDRDFSAVSALRRALAAADGRPPAEVRLNPADLQTLRAHDLLPAHATFTADENLAAGDAITVLDDGLVDARIGGALARAREALYGEAP